MVASIWTVAGLSMPLSALLTHLTHRRYACRGAACGALFALGIYLALSMALAGILPTPPFAGWAQLRLGPAGPMRYAPALLRVGAKLLLLIPFSLLTSLLFPEHRSLARQLLMGLGLAVLILALRSVQEGRIAPTDLLLYPAGSALGSGLYRLLHRFAPDFCAQTEIRGTQCVLFSCLLSASFLLLAVGTIRLLVAKGGIL